MSADDLLAGLDRDHDGTISVAELLTAYDTDHSGALDMKEMENLAARLNSQARPHFPHPFLSRSPPPVPALAHKDRSPLL